MNDMVINSKCSKSSTAYCLLATAIRGMSNTGFELRHIMYMSGHTNESSIRTYNQSCSSNQEEALGDTLSGAKTDSQVSNLLVASSQKVAVPAQRACASNVPLSVSSNIMSSNLAFNKCVFQINPGQ